jgi:hypothetical protein
LNEKLHARPARVTSPAFSLVRAAPLVPLKAGRGWGRGVRRNTVVQGAGARHRWHGRRGRRAAARHGADRALSVDDPTPTMSLDGGVDHGLEHVALEGAAAADRTGVYVMPLLVGRKMGRRRAPQQRGDSPVYPTLHLGGDGGYIDNSEDVFAYADRRC